MNINQLDANPVFVLECCLTDRYVMNEQTYTYFRSFAKEFDSKEEAIAFRDENGFDADYSPLKA